MMMQNAKLTIRFIVISMLVTGLLYPLAVYFIGHIMFPYQATGSLLKKNGVVIGSELIGQAFSEPKYFHPRPSKAGSGYDAVQSGGSNLSLTAEHLQRDIKMRYNILRQEYNEGPVPVDMVTASGSGLDPHISPAAALAQVKRIAHARKVEQGEIERILYDFIQNRQYTLFGSKRVNILKLNLALDEAFS